MLNTIYLYKSLKIMIIKIIVAYKYRSTIEASNTYDENIDPSVSNSFATAAMRSLKSLYDGNIK